MMRLFYWGLIFAVASLAILIAFKVFRMTFGISPVLMHEIREFKNEKRVLAVMVIITVVLYMMALFVDLIGGV